ncbi:MAG: alpha/beta hydrolase [Gammaproteobacteria bacterium]|nr:alpha/beta hydrolase [Gammaproteobacteria bacterium]
MTILCAVVALLAARTAATQDWGPRSLEELKVEVIERARSGRGPVGRIKLNDAERAVAMLDDLERDTWASAWSAVGQEYLEQARAATTPEDAREAYFYAWRYFDVGRWPTEKHSAGKRRSYENGLAAFRQYGLLLDPPAETVRIPFEGSEIVAYLRLPQEPGPAPLVFGMNGLDSRKEEVMVQSDAYVRNGIAAFAIDMPGTGEAPLLIDVGSERMLSAALDYLAGRPEIDASRIVVQGRSWSGYWAAVLAYTERDRIVGAAVHGVGIHHYFQPQWQQKAIMSAEYLFDLFPARSVVYGVDNMDDFLAYGPRLSLVARGLIDQPSAPMLLVNGERDSQQPIEDLYLLMRHGDPKLAWVNPDGGHMGRSAVWPDERILAEVVQPWLMQQLGVEPGM